MLHDKKRLTDTLQRKPLMWSQRKFGKMWNNIQTLTTFRFYGNCVRNVASI